MTTLENYKKQNKVGLNMYESNMKESKATGLGLDSNKKSPQLSPQAIRMVQSTLQVPGTFQSATKMGESNPMMQSQYHQSADKPPAPNRDTYNTESSRQTSSTLPLAPRPPTDSSPSSPSSSYSSNIPSTSYTGHTATYGPRATQGQYGIQGQYGG